MTRRGKWVRAIVGAELLALVALLGFFAWWHSLDGLVWRLSHVPDRRPDALAELGRLGPAASEATPALIAAVGAPDSSVQISAAAALNQIGGVPALVLALKHPSDTARWRVLEVLRAAKPGPAAVPALRDALRDRWFMVRRTAAETLGQLGPSAAEATADLAAALHDPEAPVRIQVVVALGEIGAVTPLAEALTDSDRTVRQVTVKALAEMGPSAVAMLAQALKDPDTEIAGEAADALGRLGQAAAPAFPELVDALQTAQPSVRAHAALALGQIGLEARPALERALTDTDATVRRWAQTALARLSEAKR